MACFILGAITGGCVTVIISRRLHKRQEFVIPQVKVIYDSSRLCQIHDSFYCLNGESCTKGNPLLCEYSIQR